MGIEELLLDRAEKKGLEKGFGGLVDSVFIYIFKYKSFELLTYGKTRLKFLPHS